MAKGALRVSERRGALSRVNYVCGALREAVFWKSFSRETRSF